VSRMDIPVLRCDRCKKTTDDVSAMTGYRAVSWVGPGYATVKADICPACWAAVGFSDWVADVEDSR